MNQNWLYMRLRKSPTFISSIVVNGFPQIYVIDFNYRNWGVVDANYIKREIVQICVGNGMICGDIRHKYHE